MVYFLICLTFFLVFCVSSNKIELCLMLKLFFLAVCLSLSVCVVCVRERACVCGGTYFSEVSFILCIRPAYSLCIHSSMSVGVMFTCSNYAFMVCRDGRLTVSKPKIPNCQSNLPRVITSQIATKTRTFFSQCKP